MWFALISTVRVLGYLRAPNSIGFDIRLYHAAAEAWIGGGDPWAPSLYLNSNQPAVGYAGPPQTLLPFLVLAWIPVDVLVLLFILASSTAMIWTLRRLGLPMWWLLYPPTVEGIWFGNLNVFVIALLVAGGTAAGALATMFKVYAALPLILLGRWKPLVLAAALAVVTAPWLPWTVFLNEYQAIAATLSSQAWGKASSPLPLPLISAGALIALVLLGREKAAWLAVPVLWPSSQFHYRVLGLPAMTALLGFFGAMAGPGYLGLGLIIYAIWAKRKIIVGDGSRVDPSRIAGSRVSAMDEPTGAEPN